MIRSLCILVAGSADEARCWCGDAVLKRVSAVALGQPIAVGEALSQLILMASHRLDVMRCHA